MKIDGVVHCFFEQSGTFKNQFRKLGINAYDYDIQNNFNETDFQIDLFKEIDDAFSGLPGSVFDKISSNDLIIAFYPCVYFSAVSQMCFSLGCNNYKNMEFDEKIMIILNRSKKRNEYYERLIKFVAVCVNRKIRMIFENPWSEQTYLKSNFIKSPNVVDKNRMLRGDYFMKPTAYWFWNCEPTCGFSYQKDKKQKTHMTSRHSKIPGMCSEERSLISSDYARNFICDFILGKEQQYSQMRLFDGE